MNWMSWMDWLVIVQNTKPVLALILNCGIPSVWGIKDQIMTLFGINILFNLLLRTGAMQDWVFHSVSALMGCVVMYAVVLEDDLITHLFLLFVGYLMLHGVYYLMQLSDQIRFNATYLTQIACAVFLIYGEFYYPNAELWLKSRGIAMIAVMKIVSISAEINRGHSVPKFVEYFGYMLCPANSIFGPWVKFDEYEKLTESQDKLNFRWILQIFKSIGIACFFLCISNCFADFILAGSHNKWLMAYTKALAFRSSHYFVSYLSEAAMVAAGYNELVNEPRGRWSYTVTRPMDVEFPRSLAIVVISWNIPMHRFLKLYVYIPYLRYGRGLGVLVTFFFSALLHGMNIEIALVLLSLGGFSYIQSISQRMLSTFMNACVKIRPCIICDHKFKRHHPLTVVTNLLFTSFNILHLAYLGSVVDVMSSRKSFYDTFLKWETLDMASHHIFIFTFACCAILGDLLEE